jgi:hypothetical protein
MLTRLLSLPLAVYSAPPSAAFFERVIVEAPILQILTIVRSSPFPSLPKSSEFDPFLPAAQWPLYPRLRMASPVLCRRCSSPVTRLPPRFLHLDGFSCKCVVSPFRLFPSRTDLPLTRKCSSTRLSTVASSTLLRFLPTLVHSGSFFVFFPFRLTFCSRVY